MDPLDFLASYHSREDEEEGDIVPTSDPDEASELTPLRPRSTLLPPFTRRTGQPHLQPPSRHKHISPSPRQPSSRSGSEVVPQTADLSFATPVGNTHPSPTDPSPDDALNPLLDIISTPAPLAAPSTAPVTAHHAPPPPSPSSPQATSLPLLPAQTLPSPIYHPSSLPLAAAGPSRPAAGGFVVFPSVQSPSRSSGWTTAEKGKGRAEGLVQREGSASQEVTVRSPFSLSLARRSSVTPRKRPSSPTPAEASRPPIARPSLSPRPAAISPRPSTAHHPTPPRTTFGTTLSPAPSLPEDTLFMEPPPKPPPPPLAPVILSPASSSSDPSAPTLNAPSAAPLSPQSASAELARTLAALNQVDVDAFALDRGGRSLRQRTSLQLNPYTRERALYRHLLARGGLEAAIVRRREEEDRLNARADADQRGKQGEDEGDASFVPPVEKAPRLPALGSLEEEDEMDLLGGGGGGAGRGGPKGELAMWDEAVRKRKKEERKSARKAAKAKRGPQRFPMALGEVGENEQPYVLPADLLEQEDDADYSAFGLHRSRPTSTSPARKQLKRPRARPPSSSSSSSDGSSSDASSIRTNDGGGDSSNAENRPVLDRKRAKILGRMMPAVAANRHIDNLRRAAEARERQNRANGKGPAGGVTGPVRAGQSVVRRPPGAGAGGAAAKPLRIEGDPVSSDDERALDDEPVRRDSAGHHRRLNALLNHDSIDPDVVAAMYPDDGLLSEEESDATVDVRLDDSEDEDEPPQGDIREWLRLPPAAAKAASVVDLMLSRTKARARPGRTGGGGGVGNGGYRQGGRQKESRVQDRPRAVRPSPKAARAPRRRARPKARPIVLDDDSIYGDVDPRPAGRRGPVRPRTGAFLPRPAAARRPALPPAVLRNPPIVVPRQGAGPPRVDERHHAGPVPLGEAVLAAQGVAGPRLPAAQYAPPQHAPALFSTRPLAPPSRLEGVAWQSYESFSLDFDIRPLKEGLSFPPDSDIRQGRLEDFLGLLRTSVDLLPPPLPSACQVFEVQLDPAMPLGEFQQVFQVMSDRLFDCLDPDSVGAVDEKQREKNLEDVCTAARFICAFATARQTDPDFEESFFAPVFDTLDHLLERMETLATPTAHSSQTKLFFHLHWFPLELLVRFSLASPDFAAQVKDPLVKVAEVLVRRLLEYGFNRTIKSIKMAMRDIDDDGCVKDYTAELWVTLVHVFTQLANTPGALPLEASLSSLIMSASESTGFPSQGLLAAERTWYLVQGLSAISQFSAAGKVYPVCSLAAQWPLLVEAISAVKLESDVVTDKLASSTALFKRDKYVWTVLGRCHLMASRWGWRFDVGNTLLGLLCQKVFRSRSFVKLHSDPTSDFPLFLRQSDQALLEKIDPDGDSAFDVYLKLLHLAVRDFKQAALDGRVSVRQADRAVARLLAITAPVGRMPFTRRTPPTLRELSTLINRYSFTMVAVFLNPSIDNAEYSLRLSQNFLDFDQADFKSRKVCIRAAMYLAVLHRHFNLDLQPLAEWLGQMTETLLKEYAVVSKGAGPNGNVGANQIAPLNEIIWCLSMILGSIRHIIGSRGMDGQALISYPDPALLHKSWTDGILSSSLAFEPITGAEVLQCVQSFLDARLVALSTTAVDQQNGAGESQDEFAFEFAPMDFDDPSLRLLLGDSDVPHNSQQQIESAQAIVTRKDEAFAQIINDTVSPAIYRLLSNVLSDDQGWLKMVGSAPSAGVSSKEDLKAREAYVARLVDCWAGSAAVLVQHGLKDWSSYVELGTESWKRFGSSAARRQVGLRFLWNVVSSDPSSYKMLREDFLSIWFQTIVVPAELSTVEGSYTSQILNLDPDERDTLFAIVPFDKVNVDGLVADDDDEGGGEKAYDVKTDELLARRGELLDEVFTSIAIELTRPAVGNVALQQRKALLISFIRDMLVSLSDYHLTLEGDDQRSYRTFALGVVDRLKAKSGEWLNERSVRELAYWNTLKEELGRGGAQ